jgi:glycosyltransferase involved in cell wall biosynthesis
MKIAIVVHGRFNAFELARALLERGHDVTLFTNYPKWAVERFDFPRDRVRSFWVHGALTRAGQTLNRKTLISYPEEKLHRMFGHWAAKQIQKHQWDVVYVWSGVAEEVLQTLTDRGEVKFVVRGSAHIETQAKLLQEEENRTGFPQDRPSSWMIARELREYSLADRVVVISTFSYNTFKAEGFPKDKLALLVTGSRLSQFRPLTAIVEDRCRRIQCRRPLRILNVGTFCFRKGMWDFVNIIRELGKVRFEWRFVGPVAPEALRLVKKLEGYVAFIPKQPQAKLPEYYSWADVFVLPTIEDGFQEVLGQAAASAVPILTTPNGAGYDVVRDGQTGWVFPIRTPEAFVERLRWCDTHREELAAMVWRTYNEFRPRDWSEVAIDFENIVTDVRNKTHSGMMLNAV